MALHSTLPIYKVTYQLLVLATEITRHMPRDFKASMGGKIREECLELVVLIYRANAAADKVPHLDRAARAPAGGGAAAPPREGPRSSP
jgi:hypothetical protein